MDDEVHPKIMAAVESVNLPEVKRLIEELAQFGLGVTVPHMHQEDSPFEFEPLPSGMVQKEDEQVVSFVPSAEATDHDLPVSWRWNGEGVEVVAQCKSRFGPSTC